MAKTTSKAQQAKPLEQLEALLPTVTHDELLELILQALEEGSRRVQNYVALLEEETDVPVDVLNEGLAYAIRVYDLMPSLPSGKRARRAWLSAYHAVNDLKAAGEPREEAGDA